MKSKPQFYIAPIVVIVILVIYGYQLKDSIRNITEHGWRHFPTHKAFDEWKWEQRAFPKSGITLFEQVPLVGDSYMTFSEDSSGTIIGTYPRNPYFAFKIKLYAKEDSHKPLQVVEEWYANLNSEQQGVCEIRNADKPWPDYSDRDAFSYEEPHPIRHKTRYEIAVKQGVVQQILDKHDGIPSDPKYDYMCGEVVGSGFTSHVPYFEFDDRSPDKFLFIGSYGFDGPTVDLNSIRF